MTENEDLFEKASSWEILKSKHIRFFKVGYIKMKYFRIKARPIVQKHSKTWENKLSYFEVISLNYYIKARKCIAQFWRNKKSWKCSMLDGESWKKIFLVHSCCQYVHFFCQQQSNDMQEILLVSWKNISVERKHSPLAIDKIIGFQVVNV